MKRQELRVTEASAYIAIVSSVIEAAEDSWDESYDLLSIPVPWWLESPWETLAEAKRSRGRLEIGIGVKERGVLLTRYIEDLDLEVEILGDPEVRFTGGWTLKNLYRKVVTAPPSLDSRILRPLAIETTKNGIEFMLLYLRTGSLAVLEGEHLRVSIPIVSLARVMYHTHPHGACGLSREDIRSSVEFMVNGGLGAAAVTDSCFSYILRLGFVSEDDFINLRKIKGHLIWGRPLPVFKTVEIGFSTY